MRGLLPDRRFTKQLRDYDDYFERLSPLQRDIINEHMTWFSHQRPRRWWFIGYPDPQPPSRFMAVLLGVVIVGTFGILNAAISEVMTTFGPRIGVPYLALFAAYIVLAVPMAVVAIANLAARLYLLDWAQARA